MPLFTRKELTAKLQLNNIETEQRKVKTEGLRLAPVVRSFVVQPVIARSDFQRRSNPGGRHASLATTKSVDCFAKSARNDNLNTPNDRPQIASQKTLAMTVWCARNDGAVRSQ